MKLMKVDKTKLTKKNPKKQFPDLKMMANGEHRNSNYTMFSDDEQFNVSEKTVLTSVCLVSPDPQDLEFEQRFEGVKYIII